MFSLALLGKERFLLHFSGKSFYFSRKRCLALLRKRIDLLGGG
jgi:hypothetical protein